ncbi:MAG: glycoside hydrolase family 43 protein [Chitinophagaceae bacterium]
MKIIILRSSLQGFLPEATSTCLSGWSRYMKAPLTKSWGLLHRARTLLAITTLFIMVFGTRTYAQENDKVFLFAYFKGSSADGLHLAYSMDGYTWAALKNDSSFLKPAVGTDKLMRDPCIIKDDKGIFHMVWTLSWKEKGIGYASSKDLVHWSEQKDIPVMEQEPDAKNCWAPEIFFDKKKQAFMIYWATTIKGRFPATDTLGDNDHRIYYVTTKDFVSFTKAKLLYEQGFNVIDATIQKNGKDYLMFLKDETLKPVQKNLRIATSKKLTKGYGKPSAPITGNYWAEGPTVVKIGDEWVVYFDKYRDHKYGAIASKDLKTWTDISGKISLPAGIRHGTIFTISKAELAMLPR